MISEQCFGEGIAYMMGIANEGVIGFIGIGAVICMTGFVSYKLVTRTFDLIHELPDFIIERMGGRPLGDAVRDDTVNGSNVIIANLHKTTLDTGNAVQKQRSEGGKPTKSN